MNHLRRLALFLRAVLARPTLERDMQAEMREHLEQATERLVARGLSPDDARLAAKREFGNLTVLQEEARDARGARWVDELTSDVRFALRHFGRNKVATAIVVAVLALGIGADAAIFSLMQSLLTRAAPAVPRDDSHVRIYAQQREAKGAWQPIVSSLTEWIALRQRTDVFSGVVGFLGHDVVLDAGDSTGARGVNAQFVTADFFQVLGVSVMGPGFVRDETGAPDIAAVISFAMAEELYGAASKAVGRRILVNEVPLRVVGVAPDRFQGAFRNMDRSALWIPVSARADVARVPRNRLTETPSLTLFARLAPGASRARAEAVARYVVSRTLSDSAARVGMERTAFVRGMYDPAPGDEANEIYVALASMGVIGLLILLVCCTNVSSLMVAAAVKRRHEIAVRFSLGASRARVLRQLLTESTMRAVVAGSCGLLLARWLLQWASHTGDMGGSDVATDIGTTLFTMTLALGVGILFGLSPALHAMRGHVAGALRDSGAGATRRSRLQQAFVLAQIGCSQPLLVLLGFMLSYVIADYKPLPRAVSERVVRVAFRGSTPRGAPGLGSDRVEALASRIAAHAEVTSVVAGADLIGIRNIVVPDARRGADSSVTAVRVDGAAPGWFALLGVPILLGRDIELADTAAHDWPVVIGSDLARTLWGGANPIGRVLASPAANKAQDSLRMTVVGVYDASVPTTRAGSELRVLTGRQKQWRRDVLLVRTRGGAEPFVLQLRRLIRDEAPGLQVSDMRTLAIMDANQREETMYIASFVGVGGALAMLLASLGLYGVVALAVQQRTREIGIRIALGGKPTRIAGTFLASGVRVGALGLALGLPLSLIALQVALRSQYFIGPGINVWLIGGGAAILLLAVATVSTWLPARRAAAIDPALTLRVE